MSFENKLQIIRDRVKGVAKGYQNGLYIAGRAGVSKTYTVTEELKKLGVSCVIKNAHLTAYALFELIANNSDSVIVLDDINTIFHDTKAMQILLAALNTEKNRPITYSAKGDVRRTIFRGGIIAISNLSLRSDPVAKALKSRVVSEEFNPNDSEIKAFMRQIARKGRLGMTPSECLDVVAFLINEIGNQQDRLDLREMVKAFEAYRQDRDGHSETSWEDLVRSSLRQCVSTASSAMPMTKKADIHRQRDIVREVTLKFPGDVKRQIAESGLSRSTFYERLREVKLGG